jgi:hypothetical protein
MKLEHLKTVKQLAGAHKALTEPMIRWLILNAETNGFNTCMIRIGRRVFIDMTQLKHWIETQRIGTLPPGPNE